MSHPPPGGQDPYQPQTPEESNPYAQPGQPPPAYQQPYPQYHQPMMGQKNNGMAIASMCTGIGSIVLCVCCALIPLLGGATALVLGLVSMKQIKERGEAGRGMAIAGIATGGVAVLVGLAGLVFAGFEIFNGAWDRNYWDY